MKKFYSVSQVADMLGLDTSVVYRLIKRPECPLPAYKMSGYRIEESELFTWLDKQKVNV